MFRFKLRTLLIVLAIGPAVLAVVVSLCQLAYYRLNRNWPADETIRPIEQYVPAVGGGSGVAFPEE